jgi:hypothetical protein
MKNIIPEGATHTNGNSFYMYEQYYEDEKGFWYRWNKKLNAWVEILNKPRNIKPL